MATEPTIIHFSDSIIAELSQGEMKDGVKDFFKTRFQETRTLTLEQLKTEVFGQHWRDEAWHEALQRIFGMLDAPLAGEILKDLLSFDGKVGRFNNLFLAANCLLKMRDRESIKEVDEAVREQLMNLVSKGLSDTDREPEEKDGKSMLSEPEYRNGRLLTPLETMNVSDPIDTFVRERAVEVLAQSYCNDSEAFYLLKQCAIYEKDYLVKDRAVEALAQFFRDVPDLFSWLRERALSARYSYEREAFVEALGKYYRDELEALACIKECAIGDIRDIRPFLGESKIAVLLEKYSMRTATMGTLVKYYRDDPNILMFNGAIVLALEIGFWGKIGSFRA